MKLEILTPDSNIFEGEVTSVTVPGALGSFQILNEHAPLISTLEDGQVKIIQDTRKQIFNLKGGAIEVVNNKITILAETVIA